MLLPSQQLNRIRYKAHSACSILFNRQSGYSISSIISSVYRRSFVNRHSKSSNGLKLSTFLTTSLRNNQSTYRPAVYHFQPSRNQSSISNMSHSLYTDETPEPVKSAKVC